MIVKIDEKTIIQYIDRQWCIRKLEGKQYVSKYYYTNVQKAIQGCIDMKVGEKEIEIDIKDIKNINNIIEEISNNFIIEENPSI